MLKAVDGWDERIREVVKRVPTNGLIDWKLLWRDPAQVWVSKHGRIALVGDSAHPHLPTSGQGAAQAIEDGTTIGALLKRAGKEDLSKALQAYQKLRLVSPLPVSDAQSLDLMVKPSKAEVANHAQVLSHRAHPTDGMGAPPFLAQDRLGHGGGQS